MAEIPYAPGEVSLRLEHAWNTSDAEALATFDDDARAISQWGQVWQGKGQLLDFLHAFFYLSQSPTGIPVTTLAQCEDGDQIIWTFRYPSGPNAAAIFTVRNEQIAKVYWMFLPDERDTIVSSTGEGSAALEACAIGLFASGLLSATTFGGRPPRRGGNRGELLIALHAAVRGARSLRSTIAAAGAITSGTGMIGAGSDNYQVGGPGETVRHH